MSILTQLILTIMGFTLAVMSNNIVFFSVVTTLCALSLGIMLARMSDLM